MMATPAQSIPQLGRKAITAAPARKTGSVASVIWFGVTLVRASGTITTAASGRATSLFQRMSFGFRVRR